MMNLGTVFIALGGVCLGYVLVGLAAAIGKLIGGLILKFKFERFVFFMADVKKTEKGFAFGLCEPEPFISLTMFDPKDSKMRSLISNSLSLACALFCTETLAIGLWGTKTIAKSAFTVPMAIIMIAYSLFLLVKVLIVEQRKSSKTTGGVIWRGYQKASTAIKEGTRPAELTFEEVSEEISEEINVGAADKGTYKKYLLLQYYHYLEAGNYNKLIDVVNKIEDIAPDKWSYSDIGILADMTFYYVVIGQNMGRAKYYGKIFQEKMKGSEEVNVKRAYAYWLFFVEKDRGAALQIAMEAMKMVDSYNLIGCREMERKFIQALLNNIESSN
ncbi:hypothetical protein [Eubacterium xylanophilum]|uniref:hypothetical protein n=1 Tax=Eubacterium xylanophilum TaxID=39497 RepID=UPI0012EC76DB|nr:hypothetical protein [Eubacterium xylanophilum]